METGGGISVKPLLASECGLRESHIFHIEENIYRRDTTNSLIANIHGGFLCILEIADQAGEHFCNVGQNKVPSP